MLSATTYIFDHNLAVCKHSARLTHNMYLHIESAKIHSAAQEMSERRQREENNWKE